MNTKSKIVTVVALNRKLASLRRRGKKVVFTNGCFDILHRGHVTYLEAAAKFGDVLVIGLNSDGSVRRIKGSQRPIVSQVDRAVVLAALEFVGFVVVFHEDTPERLIRNIRPDVLVKGADWKGKEVAGGEFVRSYGGRVKLVRFVPGRSSTGIIEKVLMKCRK